ncbi:MAG TPA: proline--tRNA ligase [Candidatus Saccharimonadales bacterium]
MAYANQLPKKSDDMSGWYNTLVLQSELADYGAAKGTMIMRPYGYAIWELIHQQLDEAFKAKGVSNAYFPMFIPESLIKREASHLEGFSPELAVVTIGGGEELQEKLIVRPTSETVMYEAYSKWIKSWRDLPVMINQWNSAVRWEKRTYLFLRTTEFLWQEGHTAHAAHDEARDIQKWAMDSYEKLFLDFFALPGYIGSKSKTETFAGADNTMTYEILMPGGKALQSATSHDLGQNFAKAFHVKFQSKEGDTQFVWQTSWGLSTRSIGGLIMAHGDDKGLRLPPKLAPIQAIVIPVKSDDIVITEYGNKIVNSLKKVGIRADFDTRDGESLGFKINKWELKGVPVRLEIGQKEIDSQSVKIVRRDNNESQVIGLVKLTIKVSEQLNEIQASMLAQAKSFLLENTLTVSSYKQFQEAMLNSKGFLIAFWCGNPECEAAIKEQTKATTRCLKDIGNDNCIYCGKTATEQWYFAQAY